MESADVGGTASACTLACGMCAPCVFAPTPPGFARCSWKASDEFRRGFVLDLLLRCGSVQVLQSLQNALGVTSWTLSSCARSRSPGSALGRPQAPHGKPLGMDVKEIRRWFSGSPSWTQTRYLCRVLSLCEPQLLRMASNLTNVLLIRHNLASISINQRDEDGDGDEDPALTVLPGSWKSVSGISRYRDFIGCLPVDLSKRILGLLTEPTLRRCQKVCRRWHQLAKETVEEMKFRTSFREQMEAVTRRRAAAVVSPTYGGFVDVPTPAPDGGTVRMEERNVYCGAYFTKVLLSREDGHRVADYGGGGLVATGSKDGAVLLLRLGSETNAASVMRGHVASVRAVLLREDRQLVATASGDASVRCWSLKTDTCAMALYGHSGAVTCLDVRGDTLVSGAKDRSVKVWDLNTGTQLKGLNFQHPAPVRCVKISAANIYSSCDRGLVKVWDVEKASVVRVIDAHRSPVTCLFVDEWHLLSGDASGQVLAWSLSCRAQRSLMSFQHPREVKSLSLLYLRVATGCADGLIRVFNFLTGDCLRTIMAEKEPGRLLSLHFSENSILVNASSAVKLIQFGKVFWDPGESAERVVPCASAEAGHTAARMTGRKKEARAELSTPARARGCETDTQTLMLSERATGERIKKRGLHHPLTRDSLLLRVGALQRARSGDDAGVNMQRNAALRDSWGPREGASGARTPGKADAATAPDAVRPHLLHRRPGQTSAHPQSSGLFMKSPPGGSVAAAHVWNEIRDKKN